MASQFSQRRSHSFILWVCLFVSFLVHMVLLYSIDVIRRDAKEVAAFRERIANIPMRRFEPRLLRVTEPKRLPESRMDFLRSNAEPEPITQEILHVRPKTPSVEVPQISELLREVGSGAPPETLALVQEEKLSVRVYGWTDTTGKNQALDLLRVEDLARAGKEPATIIPDLNSRRNTRGYINLVRLELYGAGARGAALDALARYTSDHTRILVNVDKSQHLYFDQESLLDDPIHFLFEGAGGPVTNSISRLKFDIEEKQLLTQYLRSGGLLYVEGGYRFLSEMSDTLKTILEGKASIGPIDVSHDLYHSFFDFPSGFPGEENKDTFMAGSDGAWYYAGSNRGDLLAPDVLELSLSSEAEDASEPGLPSIGLWGVTIEGHLVAILSDLGLNGAWIGSFNTEDEVASGPFLEAGINILMYALTREGGLTPVRTKPVWEIPRPRIDLEEEEIEGISHHVADEETEVLDQMAGIDGSLAVILSPMGSAIADGGLEIRLNRHYYLSFLKGGNNGFLLNNVPVGTHWITIQYGGESREIEVGIEGGRVSTVTFGISRIPFFTTLRMEEQPDRIPFIDWVSGFSDLEIQEMFLAEDRELIQD